MSRVIWRKDRRYRDNRGPEPFLRWRGVSYVSEDGLVSAIEAVYGAPVLGYSAGTDGTLELTFAGDPQWYRQFRCDGFPAAGAVDHGVVTVDDNPFVDRARRSNAPKITPEDLLP